LQDQVNFFDLDSVHGVHRIRIKAAGVVWSDENEDVCDDIANDAEGNVSTKHVNPELGTLESEFVQNDDTV
jgi:hypothetical protein